MTDEAAQDWDPGTYQRFRDLRLRPALDLLARIGRLPAGDIVDLGCGSGAIGPVQCARFPDRRLIGTDLSATMLVKAQETGVYDQLVEADLTDWTPQRPPALLYSNAVLHWVVDHDALLPRLAQAVSPGGWLAVQVPGQKDAPSHKAWRDLAGDIAGPDILTPARYADLLDRYGETDVWETHYLQQLPAASQGHPIRHFTASTYGRPFLAGHDDAGRSRLLARYDEAMDIAYPRRGDGSVLFPFRRVFVVLHRTGSWQAHKLLLAFARQSVSFPNKPHWGLVMPALKPTDFTATITWLGRVVDGGGTLRSEPLKAADLSFDGIAGEAHGGVTRSSCSRVTAQHPRGTTIRNVRQLSIVSAEDLEAIAGEMGLEAIDPTWIGASMVVQGIPDFTHVPASSRLQAPGGATLVVDMENRPCTLPGREIEQEVAGFGPRFKPAARGRRGVTAWVEREGAIAIGDTLSLHIPDQRVWTHFEAVRTVSEKKPG